MVSKSVRYLLLEIKYIKLFNTYLYLTLHKIYFL